MQSQQAKAEALSQWHQKNSSGLLLPNAWDCASARVFEAAGFPVVGTTSMGVAFAQGHQDGEQISPDEMLRIIARIAATVQVPVTADIEAGYGSTPQELAQTIQKVIATGVAGINLEDSQGVFKPLYALEEQCERLAAARSAAEQANLALFINARIDTYLFQIGEEQTRLEETVRRARAYLQAGASGIFVPGVVDSSLIEKLVHDIPGPLNVMVAPGIAPAPELFKLGVARVSLGGAAMLATMGLLDSIAQELHEQGTYTSLGQHSYDFGKAWALFKKGE